MPLADRAAPLRCPPSVFPPLGSPQIETHITDMYVFGLSLHMKPHVSDERFAFGRVLDEKI